MDAQLFENLDKAITKFSQIMPSGIDLSDPDPRILCLDLLDLDTHLNVQSGAIAYYSYQLNRADAELKNAKEAYDKWMKIKKLEAEAQLLGSNADDKFKPSEAKKEARVYVNSREAAKTREDKKDEAEEWVEKIKILEEYRDKIKFWYDGFVTKNFLINTYVQRERNEHYAVDNVKATTPVERSLTRMKPNFKAEFNR